MGSSSRSSHSFGCAIILVGGILAACGGASVAGAPSDPGTYPAIRAALTITPERLPTYSVLRLPRHYVGGPYTHWDNSGGSLITDAGATLGRVLFHDRQLSVSGTVACSSCHIQRYAFGDTARFSLGHDGVTRTTRHAMRLVNLRYFPFSGFGWSMATPSLESQVLRPITARAEMGFTPEHGGVDSLLRRMRGLPYYPELFQLAFGDDSITVLRMQTALAMFVRSIVSTSSQWDTGYEPNYDSTTYDQGLRGRLLNETEVERVGRLLFLSGRALGATGGCAACHVPPHFASPGTPDGIGLDAGENRGFKAPSLKNVAVAGRFMHDGRFATLEEVIDHYDHGVQDGPALSPLLRDPLTGKPLRMELDAYGKAALVAFLKTLTDSTVLTDPRFGNPFRR